MGSVHWVGEMPSLRVLQISVVRVGHVGGHETQPGRIFEKLTTLTALRELRVPAYVNYRSSGKGVALEYLQPLAGALRELTWLRCLDAGSPADFGVDGITKSVFLSALSALVRLEELQLNQMWMDGEAAGVPAKALRRMPRLAVLQLTHCLDPCGADLDKLLRACQTARWWRYKRRMRIVVGSLIMTPAAIPMTGIWMDPRTVRGTFRGRDMTQRAFQMGVGAGLSACVAWPMTRAAARGRFSHDKFRSSLCIV